MGSDNCVEGESSSSEMNGDPIFSPLGARSSLVLESVERIIDLLVVWGDGARVDLADDISQPEDGFPAKDITCQAMVNRFAVVQKPVCLVGFWFVAFLTAS